MTKPKPKSEIVIRMVGDTLLYIYVYSNDAQAFIESHAPEFGFYSKRTFESHDTLFVSDGYDPAVVKAYLEAMPINAS